MEITNNSTVEELAKEERVMSQSHIPYNEMDESIRGLVEIINRFPGLHTIDSCGGHTNNAPYQEPEGHWRVGFQVDHTEEGWRSLEFLAWGVTDFRRGGRPIVLEAFSHPPYLNTPGQCLSFTLYGSGLTPDDFAGTLDIWRDEDYISVEDDEAFRKYTSGEANDEDEAGD